MAEDAPTTALLDRAHPGDLPAASGDLVQAPAGSVVAALKPAEDGDAIVVRLQELAGGGGEARVAVSPLLRAGAQHGCDLLERRAAGADRLHAHGVATVRVEVPR